MDRKSASEMLREKYMASQLKKTAIEKKHPTLDDVSGIGYLKSEIDSKLYAPLFHAERYRGLGAVPPRALLVRGNDGVGKSFLVSCFCQSYKIPLITGFVESEKDIKELFSKSKAAELSVIFVDCVDAILEEKKLVYRLNESIKSVDWRCLVVLSHKSIVEEIYYENEIFIRIPTTFGRREMLDGLLRGMKTEEISTIEIAQHTPGFVPRDLAKLVSMATTLALERMGGTGAGCSVQEPSSLSCALVMGDFIRAIKLWKGLEQNVTFSDIGALENVKDELTMSVLLPSRFPEKFIGLGISKPSGILLFGPPGCGKTLIAKAVSNMSHCNFLSIKGPELITKYVGDSEKHLRDLFQKAKNLSPCVLFFDEIDSLCGKRGKNEFGNRIVNQILTLLDGMEDRGEVYIIGATNRIRSIDPALMRPGRFDKIIEVPLPAIDGAREIFRKCTSQMPLEAFDVDSLDLADLSGAEIAGVVKEAAVLCLKDNFDVPNLRIDGRYFQISLQKHRDMVRSCRSRRV